MPDTLLRNIRVFEEGGGHQEVLNGPQGEEETLQGVQHVSVLPPFNQENGGPQPGALYRIRATNNANSQPVDLRNMRFVGIAPFAGSARFADQ